MGEKKHAGQGHQRRPGQSARAPGGAGNSDRSRRPSVPLLAIDVAAVSASWVAGASLAGGPLRQGPDRWVVALLVTGVVAVAGIGGRGLYGEAAADRTSELVGCFRAVLVAAIAGQLATWTLHLHLSPERVVFSSVVSLGLLSFGRSMARTRLTALHRRNRMVVPVLVVGTNDEALELCALLAENSRLGFRPCGILGDEAAYRTRIFPAPWLGTGVSAAHPVDRLGSDHGE